MLPKEFVQIKLLHFVIVLLSITFISGCCGTLIGATTSSDHVQKGKTTTLKEVKAVMLTEFKCNDEVIARAVKNTIIEMLLPTDIRIIEEGNADALIKGSITFAYDRVSSGGASISTTGGGAYVSGTEGSYVSGITAQIVIDNQIIGASSVTQVRTDLWIPDPPEVMARKIGKKICKMFGR